MSGQHTNVRVRNSKNIRKLGPAIFVAALLVMLPLLGKSLAQGSNLPVLAVFLLVILIIVAPEPIRGVYLAYPLLLLIPFGVFRTNYPILNSPLDIVVSITLLIGVARLAVKKNSLAKSPLYLPLIVCTAILTLYVLIGHGDYATFRLFRFIQGLWPFVLLILTLDTPRQARNAILVVLLSMTILAILWLPGLVTAGEFGGGMIRKSTQIAESGAAGGLMAFSFRQSAAMLSFLTLVAMALIVPILLCLAITFKKHRILILFALAILTSAVLWASYASAVVTLFAGFLLTFAFFTITGVAPRKYLLVCLLVIALAIAFFIMVLPQGAQTFERVLNPSKDLSGAGRILEIKHGIQAFKSNVWIGYGSYSKPTQIPSGITLEPHSTFVPMAYEFGLLFLIPFLWLLFRVAQGYYKLLKRTSKPIERALVIGMAASFGAAIITAWATPVFMEPGQDAIIWFFIGLMTVWNHWLDKNPDSVLVE